MLMQIYMKVNDNMIKLMEFRTYTHANDKYSFNGEKIEAKLN